MKQHLCDAVVAQTVRAFALPLEGYVFESILVAKDQSLKTGSDSSTAK